MNALKAQPIVAEGNALGLRFEIFICPEGAIQNRSNDFFGPPFQGANVRLLNSEGVALGYDGSGRWPDD